MNLNIILFANFIFSFAFILSIQEKHGKVVTQGLKFFLNMENVIGSAFSAGNCDEEKVCQSVKVSLHAET